MTDLEDRFNKAVLQVHDLTEKPSNRTLLELYSLYKQATVGPINTTKPWAVQVEARAKWDAWKSKEKLTTKEAMTKYIALVESLLS